MFVNKKFILTYSLAVLSLFAVGCNKPKQDEINPNIAITGETPIVNDDIAPSDKEKLNIEIGIIKNSASALGATSLFKNSEDNSSYENYSPVIFNTNEELKNAFINGEVNVAILPPDVAYEAYNNKDCYILAVTNGCNYYIAENGNTIQNISDLANKTVYTSKEDSLSKTMLSAISNYNNLNINILEIDTTSNLLSQIKNGTITTAIIPEPYLSYVANESIRSAIDLYDIWNDSFGADLPTSCLLIEKFYLSNNIIDIQFFLKDYSASASIARRNAEETAKNANKFALIDNVSASKSAIPGCGFTFKTEDELYKMLNTYYTATKEITNQNPPDDNFYYKNQH